MLLDQSFFARPVVDVARALIGATLLLGGVGGPIVEVEAYNHEDPASHSFRGPTARNAPMFGPPGHAYVYRIYGLHLCLNLVAGDRPGSAVLLRAIAPRAGMELMRERRGAVADQALCAGPARLCQALGVAMAHNGLPLDRAPFALSAREGEWPVAAGPRIGVSKAAEVPWRFGHAGSPFLSRRF
jgi:DNA-3-methyladenine glycosylase